jgi:DNA-binding transcriptional MerR regulator
MHTIGDLARRTGLTVKAIRFYADTGLVPPTDRNAAGHRLYDTAAAVRLDLVRTLRDLGLDLAAIRRVVDREITLADVAAAHVDALEVRIRALRLRQAVLGVVAKRGAGPEEVDLLHELATLTEDQRRRLIAEFTDSAFGGVNGEFDGIARTLTAELPDDPEPAQVEAWVELAELSRDPQFRALMRRLVEHHARSAPPGAVPRPDLVAVLGEWAGPLVAAGVDPGGPEAAAVVDAVSARWPGDLAALLDAVNDPRRERYLRLLAVVNGWQEPESRTAVLDWFAEALPAQNPTTG